MLNLKKKYGYDKALAASGAMMIVGPDPEKDFLLVRRTPSEAYYRVLSETLQANGEKLEALKESDPEAARKFDLRLQCEVMSKTVLAGWGEGISDGDEVALPYTHDTAADLLEKYDDLRVEVAIFARNNDNFAPKMDVEKVKKK